MIGSKIILTPPPPPPHKKKIKLCNLHLTIAKFGKPRARGCDAFIALQIEIFFEIVGILILNATT